MTNTVILIAEFQKNWTDKGFFYQLIKREYQKKNVLVHTKKLLNFARENQIKVFHAPLIIDKADTSRYSKTPLAARLFKQLEKGTWKAEITDGIYAVGDTMITGRSSYDCCVDSDLVQQLKENEINNIVVCGFTTGNCVKKIVVELEGQGFNCIIASDCTASITASSQKKVENRYPSAANEQLFTFLAEKEGLMK